MLISVEFMPTDKAPAMAQNLPIPKLINKHSFKQSFNLPSEFSLIRALCQAVTAFLILHHWLKSQVYRLIKPQLSPAAKLSHHAVVWSLAADKNMVWVPIFPSLIPILFRNQFSALKCSHLRRELPKSGSRQICNHFQIFCFSPSWLGTWNFKIGKQ